MQNDIRNARNRPQVIEYADEQAARGTGQLDSVNAYLRNDPVSYFYQKLSDNKNEYLRDDFWSQAAQRGESESLIGLLQMAESEDFSREAYDAVSGYGDRMDYDAYMLSLQLPHLDNTEKKKRIDEDTFDEAGNLISAGTGYEFGDYTDQEWAWEILKHTIGRWDAEIIEEDKANRGWLADVGTQVVAGLTNIVGGAFQFVGDIWNLGEGLLNMLFNWSNDSNIGDRFLHAFQNDNEDWSNPTARIGNWLNSASYEFQRQYATTVNAVEAFDQGYKLGEGSNFFEQIDRSVGTGAGYTTWGRWMNGGTNAIGYMLPTILLAVATGGTSAAAAGAAGKAASLGVKALGVLNKYRSAIFYSGIFSGMIKDTVMSAQINGVSYKDLDAGQVIANAALKAVAQFAVEKALGMILGFSGVDRLLGTAGTSTGRVAAKAGSRAATGVVGGTARAAGQVALRLGKDALKEGLEELFQELSDIAIDYAFGGTHREQAIENFSIQTIADAFIVGMLTSVVMGSVNNVTAYIKNGPTAGVNQDGEVFKLGAFETLNLREAMQTMHEWNDTINDENTTIEKRASAMLSMNAAISTLGDVYRTMGTERALKADAMVMEMLNMQSKTEQIAALGTSVEYANKLYSDFRETQAEATAKYVTKKTEEKILKAIKAKEAQLKKGKVTEIDNIITTDTITNDPNIDLDQTAQDNMKAILKKMGVEAIVGVNGNIVSKSDEIVFVNNRLMQSGDIENIVKGVAYDLAIDTAKIELSTSQRKMITDAYSKVVGTEGSLDDAITALLFDKSFYTHVLLRSVERKYKTAAFEMLATIDKMIKARLTPNVTAGTITERAYKVLLEKVQNTMRTGLVTFATHHNLIDLGMIDNAVLPIELKNEINNHHNVIFTKMVNDGIADKSTQAPSQDRVSAFNEAIDKYVSVLTAEEMKWAKDKAKSTSYNDRVDAYTFLTYQTKKSNTQEDKIIYLASDTNTITDNMAIRDTVAEFGVEWNKLIDGTYNPNQLTQSIQDFILSNGYDMANKQERFSAIRDVLFNKSSKTLTIDAEGLIVKVIDKTTFTKEKYLGPQGQKALHKDIKEGKVKTLQDVSSLTLDKKIGKLGLELNPAKVRPGINGYYIDGSTKIVLAGTDILNTIMHEATHATQYELAIGCETIQGGTVDMFNILPKKVQDSLTNYIKTNFELSYTTLKNPNVSNQQILYFMLAGELQANSTLSSLMFEVGFRWKNDRKTLVSPDGKMEWDMTPSKRKVTEALKQTIDNAKQAQNEDMPLSSQDKIDLAEREDIKEFMKDGFLQTADGVPAIFYRGTPSANDYSTQQHSGWIFLSTSSLIASTYSEYDSADLNSYVGWISNLSRSDIFVFDGKGKTWNNLRLNGERVATDELVTHVRKTTNKRAILIKNVLESEIETDPANDLIVFDKAYDSMKRVTIEDRGQFIREWTKEMDRPKFAPPPGYNYGDNSIRQGFNKFVENYQTAEKAKKTSEARRLGDSKVRYISNKVAKESNLKYFIKKGVPIQLHPNVASFVSNTTKDFEKLPNVLKTKIQEGQFNLFDIIDYVATASKINDYTFNAIATYVFENPELAKIKYSGMRALMSDIEELAALVEALEPANKVMSLSEMKTLLKDVMGQIDNNKALGKKMLKALKNAQTVKMSNGAYVEAHADTSQLNTAFFRNYDGTLESLRTINNLGKYMTAHQELHAIIENVDTTKSQSASTTWNWLDKMRRADIDYEQDSNVADALENITRADKIEAIEAYVTNELIARVNTMSEAGRIANAQKLMAELQTKISTLDDLADKDLNIRYLAVLANENASKSDRKIEGIIKPKDSNKPSTKNIKDSLRNVGRTLTRRIAGLKRRYNMLSPEVQAVIDPKTYKLTTAYSKMTDAELETLLTAVRADSKSLNASIRQSELKKKQAEQAIARMEKMSKKVMKVDNKGKAVDPNKSQTLREKINVRHKTKIINQRFTFESREDVSDTVTKLLNTQWGKQKLSQVKGVTNNTEQNVHNGKTFFENNASTLLGMSLTEAEATAKWLMDANIIGIAADSNEAQTYSAIKMYFLGWLSSEIKQGGMFENFNANLKQRVINHLKTMATVAGTGLAVWNNVQSLINPIDAMKNADIEIAGVLLNEEEKDALLFAAVDGDMEAIQKAQQMIIDRVNKEKTSKKSILRKITTIRSMSMLSSPITWLRNRMSNVVLKRLNKWSAKIGSQIAGNKTAQGQFKMDGQITPEIQKFINEHFIDNKLFDTLVSNISRYNPSDIQSKFKDATGLAHKDAIFANMIIKSLYSQFYNQNMFNNKLLNNTHQFLMKMLSDNNYVREASIRYFGKIIAERGYNLEQGVTNAIMNDFANAIGMGMADYMHSDNMFNKIETLLAEKSEGVLFAYKMIMPFASASWNWFKAALKYTPVGLGQSIYKLSKLEQQIIKAENNWAQGKGQVAPELTEYLIRRDLGAGVIGTSAFILGALLAGFGYIDLEEEDYGNPKLRIGNLRIDVSTIFGTSSVLAGAALVKGWQAKDFLGGIDAMLDPLLDGFFLTEILEMDKYNRGGFASFGVNFLEQTILSFIPNAVRWISGATYTGKYQTNNMFERAVARIPFLGSAFNLDKKVNPYTGSTGDFWDIFNRVVPFFEVRQTSGLEKNTQALGINKTQLRGNYEINGEKFKLSAKDTAELNRQYGEWNAKALTMFYANKATHSVQMPNGTYRTLTYNQMTDDQRRRAVNSIMTKNAEYAKIQAWLKAGNAYYGTTAEYTAMRKLGIKGNYYKGNRGYVAK